MFVSQDEVVLHVGCVIGRVTNLDVQKFGERAKTRNQNIALLYYL